MATAGRISPPSGSALANAILWPPYSFRVEFAGNVLEDLVRCIKGRPGIVGGTLVDAAILRGLAVDHDAADGTDDP